MTIRNVIFVLLCAANLAVIAAEPDTVVVAVEKHAFVPFEIIVKPGARVRWENRERVFETPGSFPYICEPHWQTHGMTGIVHVVE